MPRQRIVVATADLLGERMAGPAIRSWHMAAELAVEHDVELVTLGACTLPDGGHFAVCHLDADAVRRLLPITDVWVVAPRVLLDMPAIGESDAVVVVDLYDPFHLENLAKSQDAPMRDRFGAVHNAATTLNRGMLRGDLFLAASERQRDFWLGALAALGRVNPATYDADPTLQALVVLAPFGVDERPPTAAAVLRGVVPGIGVDDVVALWGGGLYNWFDPATLLRAVDVVRRDHAEIRVVFLGGQHPDPALPGMRVAADARRLSDELGLTGTHVTFLDGWVPYERRGAFLLEADLGVSTHLASVETAYSFRTRILDYLWAGLPVVATSGDVFADTLTSTGAGLVVPPGDVDALAAALTAYLDDVPARRRAAEASAALADRYVWSRALAELIAFCREPRRAPDHGASGRAGPLDLVRAATPGPPGWRGELALARRHLADGGPRLLARRAVSRVASLARGGMR